jgi:hypothetical protein
MGGNCEVSSGRSSPLSCGKIDFISDDNDIPSFASRFYSISMENEKKKKKNSTKTSNSSNSSNKNVGRRSPLPT